MKDWCLAHPYMTLFLVTFVIASISSALKEIFRKEAKVTLTVTPDIIKTAAVKIQKTPVDASMN